MKVFVVIYEDRDYDGMDQVEGVAASLESAKALAQWLNDCQCDDLKLPEKWKPLGWRGEASPWTARPYDEWGPNALKWSFRVEQHEVRP